LDDKSIVVAYDHKRGEGEKGRKSFRKNEDRDALGHGDCIDCFQCVNVCPTGIDIRNGTQLECVNCTACIDECDHIMDSIGKPRGLIRYASEEEITKKAKFKFTPRMKGYAAILLILVGILTGMLFLRGELEANILRLPGQLYERKENNIISNVYTYKLLNKTSEDIEEVSFRLMSHKGEIKMVSRDVFGVPSEKQLGGTFFVEINASALEASDNELKIGIYSGEKLIETTSVQFMGPRSYN
jgi:cytochrome c oxidase accessory protein FixG